MTTPTHGGDRPLRGFTDDQLRAALERSELPRLVRSTIPAMVTPDARATGILEMTAGQIARRLGIGTRQTRERIKAARRAGAIEALDREGQPLPIEARPPGGRRSTGVGYATRHRFGPALASILWPEIEGSKGEADRTLKSAEPDTPKHATGNRQGCSTPTIKGEATCTHTKNQRRKTTTKGAADSGEGASDDRGTGGGGGDSIPEGWTEADHADALTLARNLGHRDPPGFVHRAGTLERVAWLEEETRSATNPAAVAETRLRKDEAPPPEWSESWRRRREGKRRAEAQKADAAQREQAERERSLRELSAAHLAAFVQRRALEILHLDGPNRIERAEHLREVHEAGRLFESSPDAEEALAELVCVGGTIGAFHTEIRKSRPEGEARPFTASAGAGSHDAA